MKKLYKSRKSKVIAGVCGGIAEYLDVDPVLVRLIAVLFLFTGGATLIAYIVGMIIIPHQPSEAYSAPTQIQSSAAAELPESRSNAGSLIIGIILIVFGVHFLLRNIPFFQYYWRFWDWGWHFFWPSVLILVGLLVMYRGAKR